MSFSFVEKKGSVAGVITLGAAPSVGQFLCLSVMTTADTAAEVTLPTGFTIAGSFEQSNRTVVTAIKTAGASETDAYTVSSTGDTTAILEVHNVGGTVTVGDSAGASATSLDNITAGPLTNSVGSLIVMAAFHNGGATLSFSDNFINPLSASEGTANGSSASKIATTTTEQCTHTLDSAPLRQSALLVEFVEAGVPNPILTDTLLDAEASNAPLINETSLSVHVYDVDGGTLLYSTATATTDGSGVFTIDDDLVGAVDDTVFVIVKPSSGRPVCGTMTVTNGNA